MEKLADNIELTKEVLFNMVDRITKSIGFGLQESIYMKALNFELRNYMFNILTEQNIDVIYGLVHLGSVRADMIVTNANPASGEQAIIEMKAVDKIKPKHKAQLERYMKLTGIKKGYVINVSYNNFDIQESLNIS